MQNVVEQLKEAATHGASVAKSGLESAAIETRREVATVWQNEDERNDLVRTGLICLAVLVGVALLVTLTAWLPLWLRLLVVFATLGGLGKWFLSRLAGDSD